MDSNKKEFVSPQATIMFPSQNDPFSVKETKEWGLQLAYQIRNQWFYGIGGFLEDGCINSQFNSQRVNILQRRIYAKGLQPTDKYMKIFKADGDKSFLNLPKKVSSSIPKFVDVVVNGMADRGYSITATSIDPLGTAERKAYQEQIENDKNAKDVIISAKENFGIDIGSMPVDQLPETNEELELHMRLEYKQSIELSQELAIAEVMAENRYNEMIDRMNKKNLVIDGFTWVKNEFIPDRGVVLKPVNGINKVQSYTECPYYSDCFYHGEFKNVPLSEVFIDFQWVNAPEYKDIKEQITLSGSAWSEYNRYQDLDQIKGTASLLYFTYKTTRERTKKVVTEKTGGKKVMDYTPEKNETKNFDPYKKVSYVEEVLMEGVLVLGTDILLHWGVAENMARPKSNKQLVIEKYIGVAPNRLGEYIDSPVGRMIELQDELCIVILKGQQIIQQIQSDGFLIDPDAIAELDFGNGLKYTAQNVIDMWTQTGSIFARSVSASGDPMYSKPIQELRTGGSLEKLRALSIQKLELLDSMRDVIGLNKVSDASTPDKESLVGVQKLASLNSNIATRHILDASNDVTKRSAEAILYRIGDMLKYSDLKDDFARKIGATAVKTLDSIKDLHLYDFAIFLDLELDAEEKAKLEIDMTKAIDAGQLSVADKYKVLRVKNFDLALAYMTILIEKYQAKLEKQKAEMFKIQSDENLRASQGAEEMRMKTEQFIINGKMQLQQMMNEGDINKERVKGEEERKSLEMKLQGEYQIAQVQGGVQMEKMSFAEDRKDDRTKIQATQQSALIDQRAKDKSPKDFQADDIDDSMFELDPSINQQ
jgi:hypothetical protein